MKLKKKIPLIDQHNNFGMWGNKFGGNFVPETLKKPINDLEILFAKLRTNRDKNKILILKYKGLSVNGFSNLLKM